MNFALVRSLNNFDVCLLFCIHFSLANPVDFSLYDNSADDLITLHIYGLFGLQIVINGRKIWILVYLGELIFPGVMSMLFQCII